MRTGDEKIQLMYEEYGRVPGCRCRNCDHLIARVNGDCNRVWYKCAMFGVSGGEGTDWRCGNEACGAIRIDPEDAKKRKMYGEVYRRCKWLRKRKMKPAEQSEGQMAMDL
jgi:hypothetical protein